MALDDHGERLHDDNEMMIFTNVTWSADLGNTPRLASILTKVQQVSIVTVKGLVRGFSRHKSL